MRILLGVTLILGVVISLYLIKGKPVQEVKQGRVQEVVSDKLLVLENVKLAELSEQNKSPIAKNERAVLSDKEKSILMNSSKRFDQDTLVLLAEVTPPMWNKNKLQASDLFINQHESSKIVYVSYSMRGEPFIGAVQILSIQKDGNQPKLLQTVVFTDFDIHSLTEKNGVLYLVGATEDKNFKTPAALEMIKLKKGIIPLPLESARVDLPSFAATSVVKVKGQVYVTTGNQDGGVVEINSPSLIKKGISYLGDLDHQLYELDDARYLDYNSNYIFCIKGTDGGLWVLDRHKKTSQLIHLSGATIPESKSTVEIAGKKILLALGDGGIQILDLNTLSILHSVPQANHHDLSLSVTNAASGHYKEIYTADGEAGASVFQFGSNGQLQQLASINFGPKMSVNAIKYFDGHLVMASGLGGVKIAKLFRNNSKMENDENEHYRKDLKNKLADD